MHHHFSRTPFDPLEVGKRSRGQITLLTTKQGTASFVIGELSFLVSGNCVVDSSIRDLDLLVLSFVLGELSFGLGDSIVNVDSSDSDKLK